jgi:hypothetical protein
MNNISHWTYLDSVATVVELLNINKQASPETQNLKRYKGVELTCSKNTIGLRRNRTMLKLAR